MIEKIVPGSKEYIRRTAFLESISTENEEWLMIPGTNGKYFISNKSRAYRFSDNTHPDGFVSQCTDAGGGRTRSPFIYLTGCKLIKTVLKDVAANLFLGVDVTKYSVVNTDGNHADWSIGNLRTVKRDRPCDSFQLVYEEKPKESVTLPEYTPKQWRKYFDLRRRLGLGGL